MLWTALGAILTPAFAAAASPMAIIAVVLLASSPGGLRRSLPYACGFYVALTLTGAAAALASRGVDEAASASGPSSVVLALKFALGLLFLWLAWRKFAQRPSRGEEAPMPGWMSAIDTMSTPRVFGLGATFAVMPKNLAIAIAAGTTVATSGAASGPQLGAILAFGVLGSLGVLAPSLVVLWAPKQSARLLGDLRAFLVANQGTIMVLLYVFLGANQLGGSIGPLFD